MDNSISSLIGQVNKLLDNVVTFRGRLEHHAIKEPQAQLYDALRNGFPEDIYMHYLNNYLKVNENAVDEILKDIDNGFVPYLKNVAFYLQEAVNVESGMKSSVMSNSLANSSANKIQKAIEQNNKNLEKALGIKQGAKMSVAEADKQNANPHLIDEYIEDPNGDFETIDGTRYRKNPEYNPNDKKHYEQFKVNCATCATAYVLRLRI